MYSFKCGPTLICMQCLVADILRTVANLLPRMTPHLCFLITIQMTRHRALLRTPRQQQVSARKQSSSSLYHQPLQLSPSAPSVASISDPLSDNTSVEPSALKRNTPTQHQQGPGLPRHLQNQLLSDIEDHGGLTVASLRDIVNEKPDTYGPVNSVLRRQVQNIVKEWKKLLETKYLLLLNSLNVRAASLGPSFNSPIALLTPVHTRIATPNQTAASVTPPVINLAVPAISPSAAATFTSPAPHSRTKRFHRMSNNALIVRASGNPNDEVEGAYTMFFWMMDTMKLIQLFAM